MKKNLSKLVLVMDFAITANTALHSQSADAAQMDMEEYFSRFEQRMLEIPEFYPTRSALKKMKFIYSTRSPMKNDRLLWMLMTRRQWVLSAI